MKTGRPFWKQAAVRTMCAVLAASLALGNVDMTAQAANKTLLLSQAKTIALANSSSYRQIKSKIALKEVSYKQAVKSLKLKIKNKQTFRWTPLLSFKFPEKLNFEDESSMVYKPAQIQNEITSLKHDLSDEVYGVYDKAIQAFIKVYSLQEKIAFEEEQLEGLRETLAKNKGRLVLGLASKTDVESIEKSITAAEEKLANDKKSFENAKTKLGDLLELDVSSRYTFQNPYVEADIPRSQLDYLVQYTLDHDQSYYEAKLASQLSLLQLNTNYSLMQSQYGANINMISPYVQQAKSGQKINNDAFKTSYDKFLTKIDKPWEGKLRILFIRIPKVWFKGSIDGVRYIEDEPYALFENALEYQDLLTEQKELAKDLENQVRDSYESMISAKTSYASLQKQIAAAKAQLDKEQTLNLLGELTFEEYTESQKQYEEQQVEALEALELYTSLVNSLDRLTCGGITQYMKDQGISLDGTSGGNSYIVDEETIDGARYFIKSIVEDNMFEFGVYLPEDFETDVTHYELWCDDYRIGEKTEIDKSLRHLTLSLTGDERLFVRIYNDEEFVDDCEINAQEYQGPLDITGYMVTKTEESKTRTIGTYESRPKGDTGLVEITLTIDGVEEIASYVVQNADGKYLLREDPSSINIPFQYLDFLSQDMGTLKLQCYDSGEQLKYEAYFNTAERTIYINEGEQ